MVTINDFLEELENEAAATRRLLERVPNDKMGWRPHEKSMTLGQLAMHIAILPASIAKVALQPEFDISTVVPRPQASSSAELLSALEQSVAEAKKLLGGMDESRLAEKWRMMSGEREVFAIPRAAFLRSVMLNHWYHHRGQLTVYLRENDVPLPSTYGDTADENPFL